MNRRFLFVLFGVSGATALIYEVLWFRPLSLVFGNSIYAIGIILFSFIVGLAIGSFLISKYIDRIDKPLRLFGILQITIAVSSVLVLVLVNSLPEFYVDVYRLIDNTEIFIIVQAIMSSSVLLVPAIMIGVNFPLIMKAYSNDTDGYFKDVGKMDGVNSLGASIGVLLVSFYLMPELGIKATMQTVAMVNVALGSIILFSTKSMPKIHIVLAITASCIIIVFVAEYDVDKLNHAVYAISPNLGDLELSELDENNILYHRDSFYQSVMVQEYYNNAEPYMVLKLDGLPQCNTSQSVADGLYRLPMLPLMAMGSTYGPEQTLDAKVLNIGLGCGTITQFLNERGYDTTTVEIDEYVVEASQIIYPELDTNNIIIDDARNWLLRTDQKFDLIVTEPSHPYGNNMGNLYSVEFWELMKSRLTEDGMVSQWYPFWAFPEYEADVFLHTFQTVFPYTYAFHMEKNEDFGQIILIGSAKPLVKNPQMSGEINMNWDRLEGFELNTDDRPIIEFGSAMKLYYDGNY